MSNNAILLAALAKAAQEKKRPLSNAERDAVIKGMRREELGARFLNVIHLAGYTDGRKIRDEWLDKYMQDIPKFEAMMLEYETAYKRDGEII